jgi:hypothetical protein
MNLVNRIYFKGKMRFFLNSCKLIVGLLFCGFSGCNEPAKPFPVNILPDFELGKLTGEIDNGEIDEASGLVASRNFQGKLWIHNDSGDKNRIFLVNKDGKWQNTAYLNGVQNRDWEDIAVSNFPNNETNIYVADFGDNDASYNNEYFIYKFKEPKSLPAQGADIQVNDIETIKFKYPDGARDAEALVIDHATKDLYIITKREPQIRVYRIAAQYATNTINTAEFISELPIGGLLGGIPAGATAADISIDNKEIIIKSYFQVFYWKLGAAETIKQAFTRKYDKLLPYASEIQGEGMGWAHDDSGYYTVGESGPSKGIVNLFFHKRK